MVAAAHITERIQNTIRKTLYILYILYYNSPNGKQNLILELWIIYNKSVKNKAKAKFSKKIQNFAWQYICLVLFLLGFRFERITAKKSQKKLKNLLNNFRKFIDKPFFMCYYR